MRVRVRLGFGRVEGSSSEMEAHEASVSLEWEVEGFGGGDATSSESSSSPISGGEGRLRLRGRDILSSSLELGSRAASRFTAGLLASLKLACFLECRPLYGGRMDFEACGSGVGLSDLSFLSGRRP